MSHFFAYLSRMKLIERWALMFNVRKENVQEHSLQVAIVAHALCVLRNRRFGGTLNAERAALLAVFHDATEVLTGDMPTPVKYYNAEIKIAYKAIEDNASRALLAQLPTDLRPDYEALFLARAEDAELWKVVKAADNICAYIKCLEENAAGNKEFNQAAEITLAKLKSLGRPEVDEFLSQFISSFSLSLDELSRPR
jgi:5'-deoxynucleotidase